MARALFVQLYRLETEHELRRRLGTFWLITRSEALQHVPPRGHGDAHLHAVIPLGLNHTAVDATSRARPATPPNLRIYYNVMAALVAWFIEGR
eukprot:14194165-Heterocapsa_arctica.AAC.1